MTELLAPAGNKEALRAAIAAGCDAVYLGMQKFGARAYSDNFDAESLREAVEYAHLRDVKVYVTMNTIVFEEEIEAMKAQLRLLNELGVDAVIVQDIAVFDYIVNTFEDMEAHCSTQMGIDDLEGTLLWKEMGADRVVLAREVPMEKVKAIKKTAQIPIEIFVHGALCVSYSGNCLMSGLIGYRSGNRGRCVGSCRKQYELVNTTDGASLGKSYLLSMKDLNTIEHIDELKEIDSLKIEGRMKEAVYVTNVVSQYRQALDGNAEAAAEAEENLKKTFNRTYTKGYLFCEDPKDISNISRPNNFGYEIGRVSGSRRGMYELTLSEALNQNDIIRIDHENEDVNLSLVRLYDGDGNLINRAEKVCYIKIKEKLSTGDIVYKTKDYGYYKALEEAEEKEFRRFPLNIKVYAYPNAALVTDAEGLGVSCLYESSEILDEAETKPTDREQLIKQFSRLGDTVFTLGDVEFEEYNAFIPAKLMNNARREIVQRLYEAKLAAKPRRLKAAVTAAVTGNSELENDIRGARLSEAAENVSTKEGIIENIIANEQITENISANRRIEAGENIQAVQPSQSARAAQPLGGPAPKPYLTASVLTREQYEAARRCGIETIYFDNIIRRNQNSYEPHEGELLIGGYGGIYYYRHTNPFVTDYSLNAVNAASCRKLHELGAKRVTLSYELNRKQIQELVSAYVRENGSYPSLEMIVYGRAPLLFTKYCPLKKMKQCGICKTKSYELRDEFGTFPIISHSDCTTTILNGKILNLLDEMPSVEGVEAFRLNFTLESAKETEQIIRNAQAKLSGRSDKLLFRQDSDTRGHFNKEII